jgi:hypothetical protein
MSGGIWNASDAGNTATRPGVYINFLSQAQEGASLGSSGTVAIIGTADWGLVNGITSVTSELEVDEAFGTGGTMNLLARQALRGGAARVKGYRISLAAVDAKASITLNDGAGSPAAAVVLTAKYEGARANSFEVSVAVNANDASKKDLTITEGGKVLEIFTHTDNDDLVSQISGQNTAVNPSRYATAALSGAANRSLGDLAATAMSGGNSGTAVTATEFSAALAALETQDWDLLIPSDTVNTTIQTSVRAYVSRLRDEGRKVIAVMGGQSVAGMSAANVATEFTAMKSNAQSSAIANHEGVVMVFPGIVDEVSGANLSGAQSAARVAGMISLGGFASSITKHPSGAVEVTARLTNADIKSGLQAGLCLLTAQGGQAVVESGINTLTTYTATKNRDFRKIRVVRALDAVAQTVSSALDTSVIGYVNNDATGRLYTMGLISNALDLFRTAGAIEPGFTVEPTPGTTPDSDEFFVTISVTPIDSVEKIFITARVL